MRKARWDLTLPISEARKNDEVISLSDSQMLRFIDELNGITDGDAAAVSVKNEIKMLRKEPTSLQNRRKIKKLYAKLDEIQFKSDYMCLVMDRTSDYTRACKGFSINGVKYRRLLGTNGGIKQNTIVFVSERLYPELKRRIDNGRNKDKPIVPAKLEAYQALACSGSTPVPFPCGVTVVPDCVTSFKSDIISLDDSEPGEPVMKLLRAADVENVNSDGYGLMLPSLAKKWSEAMGLQYVAGGMNTRFCWEKGMVVGFDFLKFADEVAGTRIIKDAWGNDVDLSNVELILTTSMVKLWDSYDSCEDYLKNCLENKYTFSVTKVAPERLENERSLNYQFIQSFKLDDEDIDELIKPTVDELHDILALDWRKSILFLKGTNLNDENVYYVESDFAKALMVDPRIIEDPFVRKKIFSLIKKRITDAKIGVIKVHANYSIICGDPYALCQSMFGMEVTGLLASGEIYNSYWAGTPDLLAFRAPMSDHSNIRHMRPSGNESCREWFSELGTMTCMNAWDTATAALNGCDFDGDLLFLTDNPALLRKHIPTPALMCVQRKAKKIIPTEQDIIEANVNSFGSDIGKITNHVTSMFEVLAGKDITPQERDILEYRIKCGQLYQQDRP